MARNSCVYNPPPNEFVCVHVSIRPCFNRFLNGEECIGLPRSKIQRYCLTDNWTQSIRGNGPLCTNICLNVNSLVSLTMLMASFTLLNIWVNGILFAQIFGEWLFFLLAILAFEQGHEQEGSLVITLSERKKCCYPHFTDWNLRHRWDPPWGWGVEILSITPPNF